MTTERARRLFTVEEYHKIAEAGVLGEDDRVELIRGEIVMMSPIGAAHVHFVNRLNKILVPKVGELGLVSVQNPVIVDPHSEPQPDILVLKPRDYRTRLPAREDVLLAVEVADTSLAYDRRVKRPLYAEAMVPEYWVLDVAAAVIERCTGPEGDGYRHMERLRSGDSVTLIALPAITIELAAILD